MSPTSRTLAAEGFAALALVISAASVYLATLYGWTWSASTWGALAGAATCFLVAIIAPALEAAAGLMMRTDWRRALFALAILWPAALTMEALVVFLDFGSIAARNDEVQAARTAIAKTEVERDDIRAADRRTLNEDSAALVAACNAAAAAKIRREAECVSVRGSRCRDAEKAEGEANTRVETAARDQQLARDAATLRLSQTREVAPQLVAAVNPVKQQLAPVLGDWAGILTERQQLVLAVAIGASRLLLILSSALLLPAPERTKGRMARLVRWLVDAWRGQPARQPMAEHPVLLVRDVLAPARGNRLPIEDAYFGHVARCAATGRVPLPPAEFAAAAKDFCRIAGLRIDGHYLLDVAIANLSNGQG